MPIREKAGGASPWWSAPISRCKPPRSMFKAPLWGRRRHTELLYGVCFASGVAAPVFGGLSGNGNFVLTNLSGNSPVALTVGGNSGSTTFSGVLSGSGSLTKVGNGALTLSGPNTYSGTKPGQRRQIDHQRSLDHNQHHHCCRWRSVWSECLRHQPTCAEHPYFGQQHRRHQRIQWFVQRDRCAPEARHTGCEWYPARLVLSAARL